VPQKKVGTYFAAADVVVLPYLTSSSSAVIPQAYAAGRPVVASQVGALMEMVPDGESGVLVPPGDEQALARTLIELLTDPAKANRLGIAARQLAATYCWDRASTETDRLYRSLKIS
jgi:glycosyltransferase involved in cell wall biosynthesis